MKLRKSFIIATIIVLGTIAFIAFVVSGFTPAGNLQPIIQPSIRSNNQTLNEITLPPGFSIEVFASDLGDSIISTPGPNPGARLMMLKDGVLFVTITNQGRVVALTDKNDDLTADNPINSIEGLNKPHGIDYYNGWYYIAEENRVIRVADLNNDLIFDKDTLTPLFDLPSGEGHFTRTIKVHNGSLYVSVGSSCNVCNEEDNRRASILKCGIEPGSVCTTFASGTRNAVGFVFDESGKIYATENSRDWLGNDLPPDEINLIEEGGDYGWPICYSKNIHDSDFDKNVYIRDPCSDKKPSLVDLQAHSAPLGLAIYNGNQFPQEYRGDLFVAYHGSWNRDEPTGYKIVSIDLKDLTVTDFATGWLQKGNVLGRPVDIVVSDDGSLFVSDDNSGKIYRIYYAS